MIVDHPKLTEQRRQAMQAEIDGRRSAAERNRLGQFATPYPLAVQIAQHVSKLLGKDSGKIHFADPAIGSGSFFSAALSVFRRERIASAIGIELDPAFCEIARGLWADSGLRVVQADFTRIVAGEQGLASPNLILANPPYVRHHHLESEDKRRLQALVRHFTGIDVNGLAGLYVYFVFLATAWMEAGGWAAWLIPSEFMDVNYGAALKEYLTAAVTLYSVHRFAPDDVQFGDALVSSAILIFRKMPPSPKHQVRFTFGGTLEMPNAAALISLDELRSSRKWSIYPHHGTNDRLILGSKNGLTLSDFFRIQRGIATGKNKFFIVERAEARLRQFPSQYLRPILPSPRQLKATVIDRDGDGYPAIDPQLCVIDCDLPEQVVQSRYPMFWQYLQSAGPLGILEGYLVAKRRPWYRQENRQPAPFLCTYMGRGSQEQQPFRFIWNRSDAIGTNLYLMLYPRNGLSAMLRKYPGRAADVFELLGRVSGHELRGEGRVYGGGLNKIEPSELGRISAKPLIERWPELAENTGRLKTPSLFE